MGNPSQSYGRHPPYAITQCYLPPDTGERALPALTPAKQAGTRFTYPGRMEGWVYFSVGYIPKLFICPPAVTLYI